MRSLLVTGSAPWAAEAGAALRVRVVARALAEFGPVDVFLIGQEPPPDPAEAGLPGIGRVRAVPTGTSSGRLAETLRGVSAARLRTSRRACAPLLAEWTRGRDYGLVWYTRESNWLRTRGVVAAPAVIDVDDLNDVLHQQWLDIGLSVNGAALTRWAGAQVRRDIRFWRRVHADAARSGATLVVASEADCGRLGAGNPRIVPNTFEAPAERRPEPPAERPVLLFQGNLAYQPNEDAAVWLVREIAPLVRQAVPGLRVVLTGSASPLVESLAAPGTVEVTGRVPDMADVLREAHAVAVPLRVGSGTRIKVLEAFAYGVPVVSTPLGAEGLGIEPDVHAKLAGTTEEFARACTEVLTDRTAARALAARAGRLYDVNYRTEAGLACVRDVVRSAVPGGG